MRETTHSGGAFTDLRGDQATPFKDNSILRLTAAEMAGVRAFMRQLKPGIYAKCFACGGFKFSATVYFDNMGNPICEGCR